MGSTHLRGSLLSFACALSVVACSGGGNPSTVDSGDTSDVVVKTDAGPDTNQTPVDTGTDSGTAPDLGVDTGTDTGASVDADTDIGVDASVDGGTDTGTDAGDDTGPDVPADVGTDAGMGMDVLQCVAGQMLCGSQCVNLQTDVNHCGMCGMVCAAPANAVQLCRAGACGFMCNTGFGDCDMSAANGCEVTLSASVENCGACGNRCTAGANGTAACTAGACATQCNAGFGDCDMMAANGCETSTATSAMHCGGCGRACAAGQQCREGACVTPRTASFVYAPGSGVVHVYSATANALRLSLDTGGATPMTLPAMTFTAEGVQQASVPSAGLLRVEGDAPFIAWVHDSGNTDQLSHAGALDGSASGVELFAWANTAVTVITGNPAPSAVRVQRLPVGGAPVDVGTWTAPAANQHRFFTTGSPAVYRITATGGSVIAYGQGLAETYNHYSYIPSETGSFAGTTFRYAEPSGAPGAIRMVVQSLGATGSVTYSVNGTDTTQALGAAFATTLLTIPANALATARSTTNAIAWIEADPNAGCDGTLSDADFVPSVRGRAFDTEWNFRTNLAPAGCYPDRRSDVDVIAHTDGTLVEAFDAGATTPFFRATLNRGQRQRVVTDAVPSRLLRITGSAPLLVEHSHASFDFAIRAPSITVFM